MQYKHCVDCKFDFEYEKQFCANCGKALTSLVDSAESKKQRLWRLNRIPKLTQRNLILFFSAVVLYLGGSILAYFIDGPGPTVDELVDALKTKDLASLSNKNLFPNDRDLDTIPKTIADAISTNQSDRIIELDWEPGFQTARAVITYSDGEVLNVNLDSSIGWWGPFLGKSWHVVAEPTILKVERSEFLIAETEITLDKTQTQIAEIIAADEIAKEFISFPGTLVAKVAASGLFGESTLKKEIVWSETSVLSLDEQSLKVSKNASSTAASKANSLVKNCVDKECFSLPYISIDWSPYSPVGNSYDNRVRTTTYASGACKTVSWNAISETRASFLYECDVTLTAIEVQVTYYYYLSDDYDYFYGSGKGSMKVKVDVEAQENGSFRVKSARIQ